MTEEKFFSSDSTSYTLGNRALQKTESKEKKAKQFTTLSLKVETATASKLGATSKKEV